MLLTLVAVAGPRAIAAEGDITGFDIPTLGSLPQGVARGSDGAIWFTERFVGVIGRLSGGAITEYRLPQPGSDPTGITPGPDGNLWFVEQIANQIGRISTSGSLDEFPVIAPGSAPTDIVAGPDGALWFTERAASQIGRITVDGQTMDEWPTPTLRSAPTALTVGPDGALWFTERSAAILGRITTGGSMTEFALPVGSLPSGIAAGTDGNLWVTLRGRNSIVRVTTAGVVDDEFVLPTLDAGASHIEAGPQGALWFTESAANKIGRIAVDGTITEFPLAVGASPQGITEGADGMPWFAEGNANRIARLELSSGPTDEAAPVIEIGSPADGALFLLGQRVAADYACTDEPNGSGVAVCDGPVPDGERVPTDVLGAHPFVVRAADVAGNRAEASTTYLVFRSLDGTLLEPSPRPGAWLTLSLGMDLAHRAGNPLAIATSQQVGCADGAAMGSVEPASVRTRVTHEGTLELRWDTSRTWAGTCRRLTLTFSANGWEGVPATFFVSWPLAARR